MGMHTKAEYEQKSEFKPLPDGKYPAVLDSVKLDLQNKYGARLNMTFKLPNRRLAWVDLRENKAGKLNGAWMNCKKLGFGTELTNALGDSYDTDKFLTKALSYAEKLTGHYFLIELKTFDGNGKQYTSVVGTSYDTEFEGFVMPKPQAEPEGLGIDDEEEIQF